MRASFGGVDVLEFRNCPFCKGRPNVLAVPSETVNGAWVYVVECQDMGCLIQRTKGRATWAELLKEWNAT